MQAKAWTFSMNVNYSSHFAGPYWPPSSPNMLPGDQELQPLVTCTKHVILKVSFDVCFLPTLKLKPAQKYWQIMSSVGTNAQVMHNTFL